MSFGSLSEGFSFSTLNTLSFNTPSSPAFLWLSWETLTWHLSRSYSPMFDLIAFPPLCATGSQQLWRTVLEAMKGKVLLFWQSGKETRLTWPALTWLAFPWCREGLGTGQLYGNSSPVVPLRLHLASLTLKGKSLSSMSALSSLYSHPRFVSVLLSIKNELSHTLRKTFRGTLWILLLSTVGIKTCR